MSVKLKPGVAFATVAPGGFVILAALKEASKTLGLDLVITSGTDGVHSGPNDPHKLGKAYDVRSKGFTEEQKPRVLAAIMGLLPPTYFYGFLEGTGTSNEHFHVQLAKNVDFTVEDYFYHG